jgi:lysophospholipase L1-like esterase
MSSILIHSQKRLGIVHVLDYKKSLKTSRSDWTLISKKPYTESPVKTILIMATALASTALSFAETLPLAAQPLPRQESYEWMPLSEWYQRHAEHLKIAERGEVDLLFLGDSITQGWDSSPLWSEPFLPLKAANFGIGGDTTSNLLWRLQHGALGKLNPKVTVVLIGTNNFWFNQEGPGEVAQGIEAIAAYLSEQLPETKILLLHIFPRDEAPDGESRILVNAVNAIIPSFADNKQIFTLDLGSVFLEEDGMISSEIMPDYLHLSAEGYRRWAESILPHLRFLGGIE